MDILRIDDKNNSERFENVKNKGGFMKRIMYQAKSGDTYVFFNIKILVNDTDDIIINGENIVSRIIE